MNFIKNIAAKIDHSVLRPTDGQEAVIGACRIAKEFKTASICVKPSYVDIAAKELSGSRVAVCTVIGFPHGGTTTAAKLAEAEDAIKNGARELDMVINIGKLKERDSEYVSQEIEAIAALIHKSGGILKVIVETCLLDQEEKILACNLVEEAGADYIKTSTGFSTSGASLDDIKLFRDTLNGNTKIKASGGIKTYQQAVDFVQAGCERIGTSSTADILSRSED
jgi:deoxyribose-phosphate aldolase